MMPGPVEILQQRMLGRPLAPMFSCAFGFSTSFYPPLYEGGREKVLVGVRRRLGSPPTHPKRASGTERSGVWFER
jgi:hypothetical protein